jgi:hypothetical protein
MDFILDGRQLLPQGSGMAADPGTVHDVPVEDDHLGAEYLSQPTERLMCRADDTGPVMGIGTHHQNPVDQGSMHLVFVSGDALTG